MENFAHSETCTNLMRAFAGESQARNRYTFAAAAAQKQKQQLLAQTFTFTADQERAHAEVFWGLLKECSGDSIEIAGGYPVQTSEDLLVQLKEAVHNETEEADDVYPAFAKTAEKEGFARVAEVFKAIAKVEQIHAARFQRFEDLLRAGKLHHSDAQSGWICLNCGHLHYGTDAPKACPVCSHDQGYFIRADLTPFKG